MKTALITGGSRGLGRALTEELLKRGFEVVVADVLPLSPDASNGKLTFRELDLADFDPACVREYPVFDVVICNAGITAVGDFKDIDCETERRVMEVNALGHMTLMKHLLRHEKLKPRAHVAFTSSAAVFVPWPVGVAYAASKGALDGFSLALESYLTGMRVSVTRVYPGAMKTGHGGYASEKGVEVGVEAERIAPKIIAGILKRKRKIFPDGMGRALTCASKVFPKLMSRWMYKKLELGR